MPYLIDRQQALRTDEIVAILQVRQRRIRSRAILKDNSLYHTLTRPQTLVRYATPALAGTGWSQVGRRGTRQAGSKGAIWRKQR